MKRFIAALLPAFLINACYYETKILTQSTPEKQDDIDFENGVALNDLWYKPEEIKQIKDELNISLPTHQPHQRMDKNERKTSVLSVKEALETKVETAKKIDRASENMVKFASFLLKQKGKPQIAAEIEAEYLDNYQNYTYLYAIGAVKDIGDHPPMWEWLDKLEKKLRAELGDFIMQASRLDDLRVFNYAIPIVLQPAGDERFDPPVLISKLDYKQHFVPFAGALSYWVTWGVCVGATYGAGMLFLCTPAGLIAERVMENRIAPDLSDRIWERANQ